MAKLVHLLRLPPSLRRQVLTNISPPYRPLNRKQHCISHNVARSYARASKAPKPARDTKTPSIPSHIRKPSLKARPPPTSNLAPPPTERNSIERPPPGKHHASLYASNLLRNNPSLLLYNSPNHTSYALTCYIAGLIFAYSAVHWAFFAVPKPPPVNPDDPSAPPATTISANVRPFPWYSRAGFALVAVMFAAFSCTFVIGPMNLVRRIYLLAPTPTQPKHMLRIETKPFFPLGKTSRRDGVITTPLYDAALDRNVRTHDPEMPFHSIPLEDAAAFTAKNQDPSAIAADTPSLWHRFNTSLVNIFPTTVQNIRRMFMRDGMANVSIASQNSLLKIDLYGSEMLQEGIPIVELLDTELSMDRSLMGKLARFRTLVSG